MKKIDFAANARLITIFGYTFCSIQLLYGIVMMIGGVTWLSTIPMLLYIPILLFCFATHNLFKPKILTHTIMYYLLPALIPFSLGLAISNFSYFIWLVIFVAFEMICVYGVFQSQPLVKEKKLYLLTIVAAILAGSIASYILSMLHIAKSMVLPLATALSCLVVYIEQVENKLERSKLYSQIYTPALFLAAILSARLLYSALHLKYHYYNDIFFVIYTMICLWSFQKLKDHMLQMALAILVLGGVMSVLPPMAGSEMFMPFGTYPSLLCAMLLFFFIESPVTYRKKSHYADLKVIHNQHNNSVALYNGNILHGIQFLDSDKAKEPCYYYYRQGPLGQLFELINAHKDAYNNIAVIGLGTAGVVPYGSKGQKFTFYEIDKEVVEIANKYFTYLQNSEAETNVIIGDARKTLEQASDHSYDMIVCDAYFVADIPKQLITYEAIKLYMSKLRKGGIICMHISTHNPELELYLGKLFKELGLFSLYQDYEFNEEISKSNDTREEAEVKGLIGMRKRAASSDNVKRIFDSCRRLFNETVDTFGLMTAHDGRGNSSCWMVAAQNEKDLLGLAANPRWKHLEVVDHIELLTDEVVGYNQFAAARIN